MLELFFLETRLKSTMVAATALSATAVIVSGATSSTLSLLHSFSVGNPYPYYYYHSSLMDRPSSLLTTPTESSLTTPATTSSSILSQLIITNLSSIALSSLASTTADTSSQRSTFGQRFSTPTDHRSSSQTYNHHHHHHHYHHHPHHHHSQLDGEGNIQTSIIDDNGQSIASGHVQTESTVINTTVVPYTNLHHQQKQHPLNDSNTYLSQVHSHLLLHPHHAHHWYQHSRQHQENALLLEQTLPSSIEVSTTITEQSVLVAEAKPGPEAGAELLLYFSRDIQIVWSVVFSLMIVFGLLTNLLVLATIGGHKSLHTVTNCFLLNLTVADLVTLLFNATFNFVFMITGHWPFGHRYCVANNFITNLTIAVSVFTIMFTSKERYNAIVYPLSKRMTKQRALIYIMMIWIASAVFALPALIFSRTVNDPSKPRTVCLMIWPDGYPGKSKMDFVYNLLFLVLTYLLPLMTMAIAYTLMSRVLWGSKHIGECTQVQISLVHSKQKVVKMLICVVIVFSVCWLPYHVYFLTTYYWPKLTTAPGIQHIFLTIYWLAMSNSVLNPIILLLMNKRFRRYSTKYLNFWPLNRLFGLVSISTNMSSNIENCNNNVSCRRYGSQKQQSTQIKKNNNEQPTQGEHRKQSHRMSIMFISSNNNNNQEQRKRRASSSNKCMISLKQKFEMSTRLEEKQTSHIKTNGTILEPTDCHDDQPTTTKNHQNSPPSQ